jgi:hypothetical protein
VFAAGACTFAIAIAVTALQMNHPAISADLPSRALGNLSLLPALLPGPLTIAASTPRRARREKPTPEMKAIMNSNAAVSTTLAAHVQQKNYDAIAEDAAILKQNFANSEAFWVEKQIASALMLTRGGLRAAADLRAAALAMDDAAIQKAAAAVAGTCDACHRQHREDLPGNDYEIRL